MAVASCSVFPEAAEIDNLSRKGTCIHDVTLRRDVDCVEATWVGDVGSLIKDGAVVVISREHPKIDKLRRCSVANRGSGRMELRADFSDVEIDDDMTWRLDLKVNYVPLYCVRSAIKDFTGRPWALNMAALASLNAMHRRPWLASLAYSVDLPYREYYAAEEPESAH